jgi:hypothetical protein
MERPDVKETRPWARGDARKSAEIDHKETMNTKIVEG